MIPWQTQFELNLKQLASLEQISQQGNTEQLSQRITPFNQDVFQHYLRKFINATPGLKAIFGDELPNELFSACDRFYQFPVLVEHVAMMSKLIPKIYQNSVFSALAVFAMAKALRYSDDQLEVAFLAGLLHDMGFLYYPISPDYNHLNEASIADNAIRAHGPVGAGVIRRQAGIPDGLADTVRDHHEHYNGTGYPNRKTAETLNPIVFLVNIADILVRTTEEYGIYPEHCHQMTRLVLQLNQEQFPDDIYRAAIALTLHKAECLSPPAITPPTKELIKQREEICTAMTTLSSALKMLQKHQAFNISRAATRVHRQLQTTFHQIGIEQPEYQIWLSQQSEQPTLEIANSHVIQNEICHQLARLFSALIDANQALCELQRSLKTQVNDLLMATTLPSLIMPVETKNATAWKSHLAN